MAKSQEKSSSSSHPGIGMVNHLKVWKTTTSMIPANAATGMKIQQWIGTHHAGHDSQGRDAWTQASLSTIEAIHSGQSNPWCFVDADNWLVVQPS